MVIVDQTSHLETELRSRVTDRDPGNSFEVDYRSAPGPIGSPGDQRRPRLGGEALREGWKRGGWWSMPIPTAPPTSADWSLPTAETQAVMRRVNRLARKLKTRDEVRSIDQLRADVFFDLLQGRAQGHRARAGSGRPQSGSHHPRRTRREPGADPGLGTGHRRHRPPGGTREQDDSEWRITITDPEGAPVMVTTTRRRPTSPETTGRSPQPDLCLPRRSHPRRPTATSTTSTPGQYPPNQPTTSTHYADTTTGNSRRRLETETDQTRQLPVDQSPRPHLHHRARPSVKVSWSVQQTPGQT